MLRSRSRSNRCNPTRIVGTQSGELHVFLRDAR